MDTQLIIKIAGVGILVAVACQILTKSGRDEQAMLLSIGGIVVVLLIILEKIGTMLSALKSIFSL